MEMLTRSSKSLDRRSVGSWSSSDQVHTPRSPSTANTTSAPIWRANRTGTGDTRPPSTYSRVPIFTGWNTAGTALDARTVLGGSLIVSAALLATLRWPRKA